MNWWLIGGAAALALIHKRAQAASTQCKPCYDAKSMAYRACQGISAEARASRNACFNSADIAFQNCLRACGG